MPETVFIKFVILRQMAENPSSNYERRWSGGIMTVGLDANRIYKKSDRLNFFFGVIPYWTTRNMIVSAFLPDIRHLVNYTADQLDPNYNQITLQPRTSPGRLCRGPEFPGFRIQVPWLTHKIGGLRRVQAVVTAFFWLRPGRSPYL